MSGPVKKSSHLKAVSGTFRADRAPEPHVDAEPLLTVPDPVDWLPNVHAAGEWKRLAPLLVANKLLAECDLSTFGHLCALHGKMVQLWAAGEAPTGHMISQYNTLAAAFGLSAAWRSKVKPIGNPDKANKFDKFKDPAG